MNNLIDPKDLSKEQLDFIYENAIEYLKCVSEGMKAISNRAMLLLSYIGIMIGFFVNHIITGKNCFYMNILYVIFIVYYIFIFEYIIRFAIPRFSWSAYDSPERLLDKKNKSEDAHVLKYVACLALQHKITDNRSTMQSMYAKFTLSINFAFIFIPKFIFYLLNYLNVEKAE